MRHDYSSASDLIFFFLIINSRVQGGVGGWVGGGDVTCEKGVTSLCCCL